MGGSGRLLHASGVDAGDGRESQSPNDPVVLLALVESLVEDAGDQRACQQVVRLTQNVENESEIHAAILLWKGKALDKLGLVD